MPKVSVGHLNIHNHEAALRVALGWGCNSLGLNEADRVIPEIRRRNDYDFFTSQKPEDRRGRSSPVLVHRHHEWTGVGSILASEASSPNKIAPDRFINWVQYMVGNQEIAHVNFHNHARVDGKTRRVDRVREAAEGLGELDAILDMLRRLGTARVLTGDLNTRDKAKSPGWTDAGELLRDNGFKFRNIHLDWVAWDPNRLTLLDFDKISREAAKTDHPGIRATFATKS